MLVRLACLLPVCVLSLAASPLPEGWEVRFLLKTSTPRDRPRWEAKWHPAAGDERAHLSLTQTGPAAGGVMLGRRSAATAGPWSCQWQTEKGSMHLTMLGTPGTVVALAKAPGPAGEDPWDTLQVRRRAQATRFVAVFQFLAPDALATEVRGTADGIEVGRARVALPTEEVPLPALR